MNQPQEPMGQPPQTPPNGQFQMPPQAAPTQPAPPSAPNPNQGNGPFEQPTPTTNPVNNYQPSTMQQQPPHGGGKTWVWIIILLIVLVLAGLFFASYEGWISLGGLEKYWKKEAETTTETITKPVDTTTVNDNTRKSDLAKIKDALKKYYQANQSYPTALTLQKTADADNALTVLVPTYIAKLPVDPLSPSYYYGYASDGKTFELTARLQDTTDPSAIKASDTIYIYKVTDSSTETPTSTNSTN